MNLINANDLISCDYIKYIIAIIIAKIYKYFLIQRECFQEV